MKAGYLLINILILIGPLLLTVLRHRGFLIPARPVLFSMAINCVLFTWWGWYASQQGHWRWNEEYVLGAGLLEIPLEEYLFFLTSCFSCLFIYYAVTQLVPEKQMSLPRWWYIPIALIMVVLFQLVSGGYTQLVLIIATTLLIYLNQFQWTLITSRRFWIYIALTFVPFLIFNYVLTSLPILIYGSEHITGFKVATIPIEDFLYSFVMVTMYVVVYESSRRAKSVTPQSRV